MSHVIGQGTIASNHYRTSEYRASQYQSQPVEQFHSEQSEWAAASVSQTKKAVKKLTDMLPAIRRQMDAGTLKGIDIEKLLKNSDGDIIEKLKNVFKKGDTIDPDNMKYLRKLMKGQDLDAKEIRSMSRSLNSKTGAPPIPDLDKKSIDAATDATKETIKNAPMSDFKRRITNGGLVIGGGVALIGSVMGFGGNEALQKWVDQVTGRDCGPKAEAQQLEGDEYSASVEACQQGSLDALYKLGVGALAIAGFIGVIAVTRAIPKKKAPEEEDSEDEE
tara:strand:+ start:2705 stop:3532 length:828 start_codon:yes stop_codon:yes gene_type:complete